LNIILLSGGSGKRLWPLSSNDRPKQFLKILPAPNGQYESMVQRVYRQIREVGITDPITIATGASQVALIREQLGFEVEIVQEPSRRDTFPAIALSCAYLAYVKGVSLDSAVAVLPIDPYCELFYFLMIKHMEKAALVGYADIMLMGINPTEPSENYGYIVPQSITKGTSPVRVDSFVEKPKGDVARELIAAGALWNGGVFVFKHDI
jgi:mannose-1-phosphate guanylyltransferase